MGKKSLLSIVLVVLSMTAMAQVSGKISVDAQMMIERISDTKAIAALSMGTADAAKTEDIILPFIIRIDESRATETINALRAAGAVLHAQIGSQLSADIPINCLKAVETIGGVTRIGTAGAAAKPMTDVTRKEIGVSTIDGSEGTVNGMAYTGKGVTVAVIDVGFDYQHPAYKDSEGRTRIKAVYSPFDKGGNPVVIDGMQLPGSVYDTPEMIAQLTTDTNYQTHGTHTSTIAAGTRSPQGWGGMAPDADIVLCVYTDLSKGMNPDQNPVETMMVPPTVFDALAFLKNYQEKSGKPMVVNMSIGNVLGPHNGRDEMPKAISDFIASGRLVSISTGNDGEEPMHLKKVFASNQDILRTMTEDRSVQLEGYTLKKAPLSAQLTIFEALDADGNQVYSDMEQNAATWKQVWQSPIVTAGSDGTLKLNSANDESLAKCFNGELYLKLAFDDVLDMTRLNWNTKGTLEWSHAFELSVWSTAGTQIDFFNAAMKSFGREGCVSGTTELSGNNWAVSEKAVSVGNYCANKTYKSLTNSKDENDTPLGDINPTSSYGKALNGRQLPMVTAPGTNIISAINHYYILDADGKPLPHREDMTWQGGFYDSLTGTSMSSPVVAGTIALWLQANPTLTPAELEDVLRETSRTDDFTTAKADRFGYGKVDAKRGLELVLQRTPTAIRTVAAPVADGAQSVYDLQGRRMLTSELKKGLYIVGGKKVVVR